MYIRGNYKFQRVMECLFGKVIFELRPAKKQGSKQRSSGPREMAPGRRARGQLGQQARGDLKGTGSQEDISNDHWLPWPSAG